MPTAIILIDPYNDFLHPKGKLTGLLAASLAENDTIVHLKQMVAAAREHKIPIYYGLHQQVKPGFLAGWTHPTEAQLSQKENVAFEEGSWGVEMYEGLAPELANGDVIVSKHWCSRYVSICDERGNDSDGTLSVRSRTPTWTINFTRERLLMSSSAV